MQPCVPRCPCEPCFPMSPDEPPLRMDKTAFSSGPLGEEPDDKAYWLSRTPEDRLAAIEFMRQAMYGYDPATERMKRTFEFCSLAEHWDSGEQAATIEDCPDERR